MKNPIDVPYRYGIEVEIQVVIKHSKLKGVHTVYMVPIFDELVFDAAGTPTYINYLVIDYGSNWILFYNAEEKQYNLSIDIRGLSKLISFDLGNLEIRNDEPQQTIPAALKELNEKVDKLGKIFAKEFKDSFQFAFFLPIISWDKIMQEVENTKHLNISYDLNKSIHRQVGLLDNYEDTLIEDYPHYFDVEQYNVYIPLDASFPRLHIKLPYGFKQYSKLFKGTADLPTFKEIKKGKTGYKPILLGMTSQYGRHTWMRKGKIV